MKSLKATLQPFGMRPNGGFALGSERFQRQIASMVGRRTGPGKSGRPRKEAPDDDQLKLPI
jgi:hypothetical protein